MIERILPQIDFFVVLMLENRSLDQACGWLYENDKPSQVIGKDLGKPYDGLEKDKYSNSMVVNGQVKTFPVSKVAQGQLKVPPQNPHEDYRHTNNQLYGDAHKTAYETPAFGVPAKCQGFLQDYSGAGGPKPAVLECYTPQNLSVMNGLARHYAVSDRWFCSVPTQTNPNRAFFHCGTSLGRESNENFFAIEQFKAQTIWNVLSDRGVESTTYFHDIWWNKVCYTRYTFPFVESAFNPSGRPLFAPFAEFYKDAAAGNLPPFTFLEPKWSYGPVHGNDYHPPAHLGDAETLVAGVYRHLSRRPDVWRRTLLVITFDEHGGCYDHVAPPWTAVRPDEHQGPLGFLFDRFGVRVPTLLVSPYIRPGTVFRASGPLDYDHTSLTATILKWQGIDPAKAGLRDRVATAPTFEEVLADAPRSDVPEVRSTIAASPADAEETELARRLQALPPPIGKGMVELAQNEDDLRRRLTLYEETGHLPEADAAGL
jgi:phospholipase C